MGETKFYIYFEEKKKHFSIHTKELLNLKVKKKYRFWFTDLDKNFKYVHNLNPECKRNKPAVCRTGFEI